MRFASTGNFWTSDTIMLPNRTDDSDALTQRLSPSLAGAAHQHYALYRLGLWRQGQARASAGLTSTFIPGRSPALGPAKKQGPGAVYSSAAPCEMPDSAI